jgi:peroxiredoxin
MKKIQHYTCNLIPAALTVFLLFCAVTSYSQQYNATIEGKIDLMKPGKFIFYKWTDKDRMSPDFQSVPTGEKGFTIKLNIAEGKGGELLLFIGETLQKSKTPLFVYIDKGLMTIHSKDSLFNKVSFSGSPFAQDMDSYHKFLRSSPQLSQYELLQDDARQARKDNDTLRLAQKTAQIKQLDSARKKLALQWVGLHPGSPISVFAIHNTFEPLAGKLTKEEQRSLLAKLTPAATGNAVAEEMLYNLNSNSLVSIGKQAPEFTQNDTLGRPVSLKQFRGKYVLLDFWASWCAPCRAENPNVVKVFNAYKDKGFTVLGISLDQPGKKEAWLKAIHTDGLAWTQLSDLKFWGNAVAKLYNINAVPSNFLIGPDGKIIAKNLHGAALETELAKILNK